MPKLIQSVLRSHFNRAHDYATVTVTSLAQTPKAVALGHVGFERMKLAQRLADGTLSLIGTAMHEFMEKRLRHKAFESEKDDNTPKFMIEHKMVVPIPNMPEGMEATFGGTFDVYDLETKTVYDFKIINTFKLGKAAADYSMQLNSYRVLLGKLGFAVPEKLCLVEFGRDWSDPGKGGKSGCDYPIVVEEVAVDWSIDYARIMQLARERAIAVLSMRQARAQVALHTATEGKQGDAEALNKWVAAIEPCAEDYIRQWGVLPGGTPRRCMYCNARNVCSQVGGQL